jgi:hypothetical protein
MAQSPAIGGDLSVLAGQRRPKTQSAARLPGREYPEEIMHELADTGLDGDQ